MTQKNIIIISLVIIVLLSVPIFIFSASSSKQKNNLEKPASIENSMQIIEKIIEEMIEEDFAKSDIKLKTKQEIENDDDIEKDTITTKRNNLKNKSKYEQHIDILEDMSNIFKEFADLSKEKSTKNNLKEILREYPNIEQKIVTDEKLDELFKAFKDLLDDSVIEDPIDDPVIENPIEEEEEVVIKENRKNYIMMIYYEFNKLSEQDTTKENLKIIMKKYPKSAKTANNDKSVEELFKRFIEIKKKSK